MASLYEDPDHLEKMEQEEPYEGPICDECGKPVEYYYFVVDDYIYCEDCMDNHRYHT